MEAKAQNDMKYKRLEENRKNEIQTLKNTFSDTELASKRNNRNKGNQTFEKQGTTQISMIVDERLKMSRDSNQEFKLEDL